MTLYRREHDSRDHDTVRCVEFLTTGHVTLPMPEAERRHVLRVRRGLFAMEEVVADSYALQARMEDALDACTLPGEANWDGTWMPGILVIQILGNDSSIP